MENITLYHYIHCPFCIRVRMALGYFKIGYKSKVLGYSDEKTPLDLTGKKMLPILQSNDTVLNESLEIIHFLDTKNILTLPSLITMEQVDKELNQLGKPIHNLVMPYWVQTKEFNQKDREYFLAKKEAKRGPFNKLAQKRESFERELLPLLAEFETQLNPFYRSKSFSLADILFASHLWGLYVLPEFQFSEKLHNYLQEIKTITNFSYHQDFWEMN